MTPEELAQALDVSVELVEAAIANLIAKGLIEEVMDSKP